jgi:pimeloyl-ACP methyl ester carboxylesterase
MASIGMAGSGVWAAGEGIAGREHWVGNGPVRLRVWEKSAGGGEGKRVVVLAHGSSSAGEESFDLQVPGRPSYSLMDFLAREGFDVFAPDIRGFGRSTRPEAGVTTEQAADDLGAVVEHVRTLRGVAKVGLLAWSWGTQYAGLYVIAHPDRVARYVSYAQMHALSPDILRRYARLEAYRKGPYLQIPSDGWKARFTSMTPADLSDPEVIEAFAGAAAAVETRTPTGPQVDMATRLPMVDPRRIMVPVMLIHGAHDDVADPNGLLPFFVALANAEKKYVVVPDAGHMMHLQAGHRAFQREVAAFFAGMR